MVQTVHNKQLKTHCIFSQQNSTRYFSPEGKHIVSDDRKLKNRYLWYQCISKVLFYARQSQFFHVLH